MPPRVGVPPEVGALIYLDVRTRLANNRVASDPGDSEILLCCCRFEVRASFEIFGSDLARVEDGGGVLDGTWPHTPISELFHAGFGYEDFRLDVGAGRLFMASNCEEAPCKP